MTFKTQYDGRVRIFSEPGTGIKITYEPYFDDNGVLQIKETGKVNQYLEIQSHADSVDINVILARYQAGETDVLNKVQGFFADVTEMPETYAGMLNLINSGKNFFEELPTFIKERFNNSFAEFLTESGKPGFEKKFVSDPIKVNMEVVEEAKQNDEP